MHLPGKKNPTASLQILFNQMPSQLEIMYVTIKTYIRCKHVFKNNHWDGIAEYASANSHLKTIKSLCHEIHHEGTPLDMFHSNFMMDPYYNWNPPIRTSLTAVGINDTDDYQINLDDNDHDTHDDEPIPTGTFGGGDHTCNGMVFCSLHGDPNHLDCRCTTLVLPTTEIHHIPVAAAAAASQTMTPPEVEFHNGALVPLNLIPSSTSKSTQLTLDQFENNYRLFSQRLKK